MSKPTDYVSAKYGAPMGRPNSATTGEQGRKWTLQRVRLDRGGYDQGGAYWGVGQPLYYAADDRGQEQFFRASNRASAKAWVRDHFNEKARFYN